MTTTRVPHEIEHSIGPLSFLGLSETFIFYEECSYLQPGTAGGCQHALKPEHLLPPYLRKPSRLCPPQDFTFAVTLRVQRCAIIMPSTLGKHITMLI